MAVTKECPECHQTIGRTAQVCPTEGCGHKFVNRKGYKKKKKKDKAGDEPAAAKFTRKAKAAAAAEPLEPEFIAGTGADGSLVTFWPREGEYKSYTPAETLLIGRVLQSDQFRIAQHIVGEVTRLEISGPGPISVKPVEFTAKTDIGG